MKDIRLFGFWLLAFETMGHYCVYRTSSAEGLRLALVGGSFIWVGLLIGISFTESWVKFKSTILERQVALDVGKLVFDALNTLELAIAISMLTLLHRFQPFQEKLWGIPLLMAFILGFQAFYLTPRLELRALFIVAEELSKKKHATRADEKTFKAYKVATTLKKMPPTWMHHLYVILEVLKIGLLLKYTELISL